MNYQLSQLESASKLLERFGAPGPHTVAEKILAIKVSAAARQGTKDTGENYYTRMKQLAHKIAATRLQQGETCGCPAGKICLVDWRDDLEQVFWV